MRLYQRGLCVAGSLLLAAGCADPPEPPAKTVNANSTPAALAINDTPQSEIQPPADESLTLDEYLEAGIPAHDRSWTGEDMTRAANILVVLAQTNASQLPRYRSETSGKAFERLTANDNLDFYRNQSLPLEQRLPDALNYMQSSNQIMKLYLAAFNQNAIGGSELIELMGAQLRVSVVIIQLVNELTPTLDKDDPTYPIRMEGLNRMKNGLATTVAGSLQTLTESHAFRTSELKRFAGYMEATFPDILPEIPDGSRTESLIRLRSFSDDPKMQHLNPELHSLVAAAENSLVSAKAP